MGTTLSDLHRTRYIQCRNEGMTHKEAIDTFPRHMREQVERELEMDGIESHFGIKVKYLFIIIVVVIIGTIIFGLYI